MKKYKWDIKTKNNIVIFLKRIWLIVFLKRLIFKLFRINPFTGKSKIDIISTFSNFVPHSYGKYKQMSLQTIGEINNIFPKLLEITNKVDKDLEIIEISNLLTDVKVKSGFPNQIEKVHSEFGSNKFVVHNYSEVYAKIFTVIPQAKNILEIGLGTNNLTIMSSMAGHGQPGSSLKALSVIFPKAKIYGADIDKDILFTTDKIKTYYLDQLKMNTYQELGIKINQKLDLIIDDGLHSLNANFNTILFSIDNLNKGGWLIIEDIGLNSRDPWLIISKLLSNKFENYLIKTNWAYLFVLKQN